MSVYPNSTRQFIQKTANLVSIAPILIREDRSIALVFDGDAPYKFEIFHLTFIVTKSGGICVKSYLADDNMIHYTNLLDLNKIKLQHVLCILTSNISVMEANAYNDDLFTTVYNHIKKLIVQVKDRIGYEPFIMTPYFQIGVNKYSFKIHHLEFTVETIFNEITEVGIRSLLGNDIVTTMTDIKKINYSILYFMLTLLEYNRLNFKNEQKFITKLMHYVRGYIFDNELSDESDIYVSQYFRITNNKEIGVLFKQDGTNIGADSRYIGRILRSMGTFNIALFGALHAYTMENFRSYNPSDKQLYSIEQNQLYLNRSYDTANIYRNKKSGKDASFKQRTKMILDSLNNEDIQELINISLIPFIGQCAALSDIKLLFKNTKSESIQPQKTNSTMPTPFDPTTVSIVFQKTTQQENNAMKEIIKHIEYLRVYDYMSAKEFTSSVLNVEGFTLVSISELLECTNSTDQFLELAKSKTHKGDMIDMINIGHTVKYAKLVIRHNHKTKGYSIGKDKVKFKDFNELCCFLSDVEKLVSLFYIDKPQEKKTEQQVKLEEIKKYIDSKIIDVRTSRTYRSTFKMLDFLTDNHLWMDLKDKLQKMVDETPGMHLFNSVPESVSIEYEDRLTMEHTQNIYVSCSYNQQDEQFSPVRVFRDETIMLQWLMDPINLVRKLDKEGKLVKEKQTKFCKRTMFDATLNEYLRSNTSIPYKKGIVYHSINLKDFAMWFCSKKGGHDNLLLDIYNAPTENLGNYRFFINNSETNGKYLYSLRGCYSDTTSIDWTTNVNDIYSYLFDKYVKSGFA